MTPRQIEIGDKFLKFLAVKGQANVDQYFYQLTEECGFSNISDQGQIGLVRSHLIRLKLIEPLGSDQHLFVSTSMGINVSEIGLQKYLLRLTNRDHRIDAILSAVISRHLFTHLYKTLIEDTNDQNAIDSLMTEMMEKGLIKKEEFSHSEMDVVVMDYKGDRVKEAGGWLKQIIDNMTEEQKLHQILEYITSTDPNQFEWTPNDLSPAFDDKLDRYEIEYLCQKLIDDDVVISTITKGRFSIGFGEKGKQAFGGKKYLRNKPSQVHQVEVKIGQLQQVTGTVHGNVSQESGGTKNKTLIAESNKDKGSGIRKKIMVGVTVGLIVALILYYIFGIKG